MAKKHISRIIFLTMLLMLKNTWKCINQIININSESNKSPSSLIVNNKLISDPIEVASSFNKYLTTVAEKLQSNICHIGCDLSKYLMNEFNFFITPTDSTEVIDSSLHPTTVLRHRILLQTTCYNHLRLLHLISSKGKQKHQQARKPP